MVMCGLEYVETLGITRAMQLLKLCVRLWATQNRVRDLSLQLCSLRSYVMLRIVSYNFHITYCFCNNNDSCTIHVFVFQNTPVQLVHSLIFLLSHSSRPNSLVLDQRNLYSTANNCRYHVPSLVNMQRLSAKVSSSSF